VIGFSTDHESKIPVRLTVNLGNILGVMHFEETFSQIPPLPDEGVKIVLNNRANGLSNVRLLDSNNLGFVTPLQLNSSDDMFVGKYANIWEFRNKIYTTYDGKSSIASSFIEFESKYPLFYMFFHSDIYSEIKIKQL